MGIIIKILKWLVWPYSEPQNQKKKILWRDRARKNVLKQKKEIKKKEKITGPMPIFAKSENNPIILPRPENNWEAWQTFNPGAVLLQNKVHFLYRAIGEDGTSRFGYAASTDGFTVDERLPYPVYEHPETERVFNVFSYFSGGSWGGAEDPRMVALGEDTTLYVTYTACDRGELRVALTAISFEDFLKKKWKWREPVLLSPPGEIHKNWLLFPEKINGRYAILHSIKPDIQIEYVDSLGFDSADYNYIRSYHSGPPQKGHRWDKWIRGAGAPPVKTRDGWLLFYHAMDDDWSKYKVGAALLDLEDPTKVLYRAKEPVLEPSEQYETNGYKPGVVYASGAVVMDGNLFVYYGCSDNYIGVASANLGAFLEALKKGIKPKLSLKTLKKKEYAH